MQYIAVPKIVPTEAGIEVWTSPSSFIIVPEVSEYKGFSEQWASAEGRIYKLWGVQFVYDAPSHTVYYRVD